MKLFNKTKSFFNAHELSFFWTAFIVLSVSKLILIANNEILALYAPHDEMGHILAASRAYWFTNEYTQMTFVQYPIYSLFIYITHFSGIPLRIIIEILYILSGLLFSLSLIKAGINKFFGIACLALIIFQPISFDLFDHTLAETLYAPLLLLSMASFICLWLKRDASHSLFYSITTGILFALLWFTRKESLLIAFFLFFVFLLTTALSFRNKVSLISGLGILKRVILIPAVVIMLFYIFICTANYQAYGIFAPSELDGNGYESAYKALQRIKTSNTIRFVPVSTEAREIAYSISPSFQELRPVLEDRSNFAFFWTKKAQGIDNEMAAGWFYWMLRDATFQAGYKTASSSDLFYNKIAAEINSAIEEKHIESRIVLFNFIDPNFVKFIREFPTSFINISRLFTNTQKTPPTFDDSGLSSEEQSVFDEMTNRRIALVEMRKNHISKVSGWAFVNDNIINSITLTDFSDETLASSIDFKERPDVKKAYEKENLIIPLNTGFSVSYSSNNNIKNGFLRFETDGDSFKIPIKSLRNKELLEINNGNKTLIFFIENKSFPKSYDSGVTRTIIKEHIWKYYGKIISIISITSLLILVLSTIKLNKPRFDDFNIIIIFISFIIITRVSLFSLLDTSSWDGAQARYIFPVITLYGPLLLLILNKFVSNKKY